MTDPLIYIFDFVIFALFRLKSTNFIAFGMICENYGERFGF